jgi:hypothetical protein
MDPEAKKLLNSLKCPLCKAPIDLIEYSSARKGYNFACAINIDHYLIDLIYDPLMVNVETVNVYDHKHKYEISKFYKDGIKTSIKVYETDLESRVIYSFKEKKIVIDIDAFNFAAFNAERAINRIKVIFVFH